MKAFLLLCCTFFILQSVVAQSNKIEPADTISHNTSISAVSDTLPDSNLFDNENLVHLTLKYDITSFIKQKLKGEYLDAELHVEYENYSAHKNIRLKARGNNRRQQCFFPPIYLNFKTDPIKNTELVGYKKIKLITHCSSSKSYSNYLLREYLVYKIYNILSDYSFRVKLLDIEYIDTGKKGRHYERFGVLIEPIDMLAKRTNSTEIDGKVIKANNVVEYYVDIAAMFQYMIGNTDWRIKGGHNTKYIKSLEHLSQEVIPIPYDFDYAGFVNTHYSHPQEWTSIESVREREYLGYCRNEEAYLRTIQHFLDKKEAIFNTIANFTYLPERDRKELTEYIKSFYTTIENTKYCLFTLKNECRNSDF